MKRGTALALLGALWAGGIVGGFRILIEYEFGAGEPSVPPDGWPAESRLRRAAGQPTLVMLVHPKCPCSRASLGELAWIMARAQDQVQAYALFVKPAGATAGWEKGDLWNTASSIPGLHLVEDEGGGMARLFRAHTSGDTILYDAAGRLVFNGGITGSRGHSGGNMGRSSVVDLLHGAQSGANKTPVFGCALANSGAPDARRMSWKF